MKNILLIIVDQWQASHFSHLNGPVHTPTIDRIAERGAWFSNAFTSCPLCTPARGALLTGRWPEQTRVYDNYATGYSTQAPFTLDIPTWIDRSVAAGKHTGYFGKWHLGPNGPVVRGAHRYTKGIDSGRKPYSPAEPDSHSYQAALNECDEQQATLLEGRAPFWGIRNEPDDTFEPNVRAHEGIGFLDEFASDNPADSFFLTVSFSAPHFPHFLPGALAEKAQTLEPVIPVSITDAFEGKPWWHAKPWWPSMDTSVLSDEEWRTVIQFSYAHMMAVDESIGRIVARLEEHGLRDDTTIVFLADHGDTGGPHNRFDKGAYFYDEVWRIPLLIAGPGVAAGIREEFVCITDVGATLTDLVQGAVTPVTPRDGRSLLRLLRRESPGDHFPDLAFGRYDFYNGMSFAVRAVRDRRFTYVWNPQDVDELYDNKADPDQMKNRISDPKLKPERDRLRDELDQWMADVSDTLPQRAHELPEAGTIIATGTKGP